MALVKRKWHPIEWRVRSFIVTGFTGSRLRRCVRRLYGQFITNTHSCSQSTHSAPQTQLGTVLFSGGLISSNYGTETEQSRVCQCSKSLWCKSKSPHKLLRMIRRQRFPDAGFHVFHVSSLHSQVDLSVFLTRSVCVWLIRPWMRVSGSDPEPCRICLS